MTRKPTIHEEAAKAWKESRRKAATELVSVPMNNLPDPERLEFLWRMETVLANPPANRPASLKAPSDPEFAFRAIYSHVAGMDKTSD